MANEGTAEMSYRYDHLHLRSRDAVAAARFYTDALGALETGRTGDPVSRITLDLGGVKVFIDQAPEGTNLSPPPPNLGIEHICFCVEDIDAAVADLKQRGAKFESGVTELRPGIHIAFFYGPDDVYIELLQRG